MTKPKIDRTTGYKGIYLYDPSATSKRYYIQFRYGKNPRTGKPVTIKRMVDSDGSHITSLKRAQDYLKELKEEADNDIRLNYDNHMLYSDFMNKVYIPAYKTEVQENTFITRKNNLNDIRNRFGHLALKDISRQHAQDFRTYLLTSKDDGGSGYSQSTASLVFGIFKQTLDKAVELEYLGFNPTHNIKSIPKGRAQVAYWTIEEFEKVTSQIYIEDFYQHLHFVMLRTYFTTGVRVNEGCALFWEDIDFEKNTLSINHMLIMKNKNDWERKKGTKTSNGTRIISLDYDTINILLDWRKRQAEVCETNFIFSYDGKPMQKSTIGRFIERYSKLANVHRIQPKGLRHSHVSYLINDFNVDILMLSKRLGHSGPEITFKHYAHMYPNRDEVIAENITGNISIKTSEKNQSNFNGNQNLKLK
ncbi:tyrosine-type recombinase/integrase [Vagococcus intermedius]|uniref:Site-specific integrase n=1 Tax=Vagococcus intermedius TaxID=2991418 RepID=A0AAF0CV83_9ENTE|nr:site-specific integrase [Vagococcus intermedius]WEG73491.1 site-specific integrase [Vagococcus intermedius]WEG75575.1 site-specific integrase [Vagococcus intermedius]